MQIIIFGLGQSRVEVEKALKSECEIVGYTDSYAQIEVFNNKKFIKLCDLKNSKFDYIIISMNDLKTSALIKNMLEKELMIPNRKIIEFYKINRGILPVQKVDRVMQNPDLLQCDGIILGNSHAECGIISEYLNTQWINLSIPSQDIYYNYKSFLRAVNGYADKLEQLKYVIIDMYDYNCFNIDLSRTTGIFDYMSWGGIRDEHNFNKNIHYRNSFERELELREKGLKTDHEEQNVWNMIFDPCFTSADYRDYSNWARQIKHIEDNVDLTARKFIGSNVEKHFNDTIEENIAVFEQTLKEIYLFNPHIKIYITLIPRFISMEKVSVPFLKGWREEYYKIINRLEEKYPIKLLDFKGENAISQNKFFYFDSCHLNAVGGIAFTSLLNTKIEW